MTQEVLADFLWLTRSQIARLETGKSQLTAHTKTELATIFNVAPAYFEEGYFNPGFDGKLDSFFEDILLEKASEPLLIPLAERYSLSMEQEISWCFLLIAYYFKKGEFIRANQIIEEEMDIFNPSEDCLKNSKISKYYFFYKVECDYLNKDLSTSYTYSKLLIPLLHEKSLKGSLLLQMAKISLESYQNGRAYLEAMEAYDLLSGTHLYKLQARALTLCSSTSNTLKLTKEAHYYLEKLLVIADQNKFPDYIGIYHQHKGFMCKQEKDFDQALFHYEQSAKAMENPIGKMGALISLISTHLYLRNLEKAKEYLQKMNEMDLSSYEEFIALSFEAQIQLYEGKIKEHGQKLKKVEQYFIENKRTKDLEYVYTYLATYYSSKNAYKKATEYFMKREQLNEKND